MVGFLEVGKKEAELVTGGTRRGEKGFYVEPTIFLNPEDDARIYREEIFGPVITMDTHVQDGGRGCEAGQRYELWLVM